MNRLIALILALILTVSLTACVNKVDIVNSKTPALQASLSQGDAGFVGAVDNEQNFRPRDEGKTYSPQKASNPVYGGDEKIISVDITATNAYVINADTNFVLFQKSSNESISPASTAKMLTALTVLEYCSLDDAFTVGSEIELVAFDSSTAWLNQGDKLTVKQLLVAMLLPSGSDASYTLAVNVGKIISGKSDLVPEQAVKSFVDTMNHKAKKIGAVSSNFTNPDGYDEEGQYTTAFDLAQIAKACLDNDVLFEIMGSYKISQSWSNGREVTYTNTNELINPNSQYYYSRAVGLKTGSTGNAGACIVSAASINGQTYICVVMGSSSVGVRFVDSLTVFNAIDPITPPPPINNDVHSTAPVRLGGIE